MHIERGETDKREMESSTKETLFLCGEFNQVARFAVLFKVFQVRIVWRIVSLSVSVLLFLTTSNLAQTTKKFVRDMHIVAIAISCRFALWSSFLYGQALPLSYRGSRERERERDEWQR